MPAAAIAAIRFTFEIDKNGNVRPLSTQRLRKRVVPSRKIRPAGERSSGFWFELRNANDLPVYQRAMDDPSLRYEGPIDDRPDHSREDQALPDYAVVSLVFPDVPSARLVIYASRPAGSAARRIADIKLDR